MARHGYLDDAAVEQALLAFVDRYDPVFALPRIMGSLMRASGRLNNREFWANAAADGSPVER